MAATLGALEFVILGIYVSCTDFEFEVPLLAQDELVSVADPGAGIPPLLTIFAQRREVRTEEFQVVVDVAEIVFAAQSVQADKVA